MKTEVAASPYYTEIGKFKVLGFGGVVTGVGGGGGDHGGGDFL